MPIKKEEPKSASVSASVTCGQKREIEARTRFTFGISGAFAVVSILLGLIILLFSPFNAWRGMKIVASPIFENHKYIENSDGCPTVANPKYIEVNLDHEERYQIECVKDIDMAIGDVFLPYDLFRARFERVKEKHNGRFLRFRIYLKDDRFADAVIVPRCEHILFALAPYPVGVPVNQVLCFRTTPVSADMTNREEEFLTDNEARVLFHEIMSYVKQTRLDVDSILSHLPLGIWNRYHPIKSAVLFIVIGLLTLLSRIVPSLVANRQAQKKQERDISNRQESR